MPTKRELLDTEIKPRKIKPYFDLQSRTNRVSLNDKIQVHVGLDKYLNQMLIKLKLVVLLY